MRRVLVVGLIVTGCASSPSPLTLSYPYADADYDRIDDLPELADRAASYYVKVLILGEAEGGSGPAPVVSGASGIVIDGTGHVVTVAHIARDVHYRAAVTAMDGSAYPAEVVHIEPAGELALLRSLVPLRIPAVPYRKEVSAGEPVFAIGTPAGRAGSVTVGRVRSPRSEDTFRYHEFGFAHPIVVDMRVEPGYSGGPVFDAEGWLIGMVAGFNRPSRTDAALGGQDEAYVIPAPRIHEFLERSKSPATVR